MSSFGSNSTAVIIPSGNTLSNAMPLSGTAVVGIVIPATATVSFKGSIDETTFYDIYKDDGTQYTVTCASGRLQTVDLNQLLAPRFIKVQVAGAVAADTTVLVITKEI